MTGSEVVSSVSREGGSDCLQTTEIRLIQELHAKISEQSILLKDLKRFIEGGQNSAIPRNEQASHLNVELSEDEDDQDIIKSPADHNTESAPVVIIRNTIRKAHGGYERLTNHGVQGLVACGFFSYTIVVDLLNLYAPYHNLLL